jgi:RNA polymerase sigma factor (sigma-70 family)
MPAQLYGRRLKASNEILLERYGNLAKYVAGKYAKSFKLSREQTEDLVQSLMLVIFKARPSYRNPKGISIILKTQIRDLIGRTIKHEPEIRMGLLRGGEGLAMIDAPPALEPHLNGKADLPRALQNLDCLSSPERVVIGMTYGLEGFGEFSDTSIAIRVGRSKSWVSMKRKQAIFKLQNSMGLDRTDAGL